MSRLRHCSSRRPEFHLGQIDVHANLSPEADDGLRHVLGLRHAAQLGGDEADVHAVGVARFRQKLLGPVLVEGVGIPVGMIVGTGRRDAQNGLEDALAVEEDVVDGVPVDGVVQRHPNPQIPEGVAFDVARREGVFLALAGAKFDFNRFVVV